MAEFRALLSGSFGTKSGDATDVASRFQAVLRSAKQKGLSLDAIFDHFDADRNGFISTQELSAGLRKLPHFSDLSAAELRGIVTILDSDNSGEISMEEFRYFVQHGKVLSKPSDGDGSKRELFARHMRRISEPDGGVHGLLAYLDDDEDGLISVHKLWRLLRREGVFETLPENELESLLAPLTKDNRDQISVVALLRFLEGSDDDANGDVPPPEGDVLEPEEEPEYDFSRDPELKSLEKKLRGVGRLLAKRGMDVEALFQSYDVKESGCIRRTDFVEALSRLGLYLLEQGKVLREAEDEIGGGPGGERIQRQLQQVRRLKGNFADSASRAARKFVMGAAQDKGGESGAGEFKVILYIKVQRPHTRSY